MALRSACCFISTCSVYVTEWWWFCLTLFIRVSASQCNYADGGHSVFILLHVIITRSRFLKSSDPKTRSPGSSRAVMSTSGTCGWSKYTTPHHTTPHLSHHFLWLYSYKQCNMHGKYRTTHPPASIHATRFSSVIVFYLHAFLSAFRESCISQPVRGAADRRHVRTPNKRNTQR